MRKRLKQVALFFDAAPSTSSEVVDIDEFMRSTSGQSTATMMFWMKTTTNAISDTGRKESVQVALLQAHGEDGASEFHRCISARSVQRDIPVFLISFKLLKLRAIGEIFLCQLVHLDALLLGPTISELRITIS